MDNEEQIVNVLESFLHDVMEEESTLDEIINVLGYNELKVLLKLAKKGLSDPIPLPTIKQGDKVKHPEILEPVTVISIGEEWTVVQDYLGYRYDVRFSDLEVSHD
ncbi:hypothetical protein D3C76_191050 [compost metagenome]